MIGYPGIKKVSGFLPRVIPGLYCPKSWSPPNEPPFLGVFSMQVDRRVKNKFYQERYENKRCVRWKVYSNTQRREHEKRPIWKRPKKSLFCVLRWCEDGVIKKKSKPNKLATRLVETWDTCCDRLLRGKMTTSAT